MTTAVAEITLMTVPEAAEFLRLSPSIVYEKVDAGELAAVRLGRGPKARIRITGDELGRYMTEGAAEGA
jgi:excisionase family DNA binding protein